MRFAQGDAIRDYVFPLATVAAESTSELRLKRYLGTGFLIGSGGIGLTAAHVLGDLNPSEAPVALFASDNAWLAVTLVHWESHKSEDCAALLLDPVISWTSFLNVSSEWVGSSLEYNLWGYPEDAYYDNALLRAGSRPDLVFSAGHVRRRLTGVPIPAIKGASFFELSGLAGGGCSGSPIINRKSVGRPAWTVVGIYLGEKTNDRSTSVGYGLRLADILPWTPSWMDFPIANV